MDSPNLLRFVFLYLAVIGFCYGSGLLPDTPLNGALGGSVTFTTIKPPAQPEQTVDWNFNRTVTIMNRKPGFGDVFGSGYEIRITLDNSTGSLQLRNLVLSDTGQYRVTMTPVGGNSLTGNTTLKVYEPISGATITTTPNPPIIKGRNVTLTCAASGSIISRDWMKDGQHLSAGVNITISEDKKTLFISPVNKGDAGKYLCKLTNPLSSAEAEYSLTVNYGPEKVGIVNSPNEIEVGQKFTLTCSADSVPTANYTWMRNGTEIPGQSPEFTKEKSEYSDSGDYICTATNSVTGKQITSLVHKLSVKEEGSLSQGLSAGAIAGIVIGVLLVVGAAVGVAVYFMKKKGFFKNESSSGSVGNTGKTSANGGGPGGNQELAYADITQFQKRDGGSVQLGNLGTSSTEYAQVRVNNRPGQPA